MHVVRVAICCKLAYLHEVSCKLPVTFPELGECEMQVRIVGQIVRDCQWVPLGSTI